MSFRPTSCRLYLFVLQLLVQFCLSISSILALSPSAPLHMKTMQSYACFVIEISLQHAYDWLRGVFDANAPYILCQYNATSISCAISGKIDANQIKSIAASDRPANANKITGESSLARVAFGEPKWKKVHCPRVRNFSSNRCSTMFFLSYCINKLLFVNRRTNEYIQCV